MKPVVLCIDMLMVLIVAAAFSGCPHPLPPVPTPVPDASGAFDTQMPSDLVQQACFNLKRLGCPEGLDMDCEITIRRNQDAPLVDLNLVCIATAKTMDGLIGCGTVACEVKASTVRANCSTACANVKKLGCTEAAGCLEVCHKNQSPVVVDLKLDCLTKAKTKASIRKCGTLDCP